MPHFYFHLTSRNSRISDDTGKELGSLNDAYEHARKLIDKILFYTAEDDASEWNVIISNEADGAQITVPFPKSTTSNGWIDPNPAQTAGSQRSGARR